MSEIMETWLRDNEEKYRERGYRKYRGHYKNESFCYWKMFENNYQIGILIYDFTNTTNMHEKRIGIQYECMVCCQDRVDLSVSKNITIDDFEVMAKDFYVTMKKYV